MMKKEGNRMMAR